ncbi:MAG: asparaginase domain-containing protein [Bacteroidota bacterium]
MKILFIQTGGTIDKDYPKKQSGYAFEFGEPATKRILEKLDMQLEYEIITAFQKDSLDITEEDRQKLVQLIKGRKEGRIIITHGTDTLIETARYLESQLKKRCVVLTGAMRPERFSNSDAAINLGMALAAVQLQDDGVYICIQGLVQQASLIQRSMESGSFF